MEPPLSFSREYEFGFSWRGIAENRGDFQDSLPAHESEQGHLSRFRLSLTFVINDTGKRHYRLTLPSILGQRCARPGASQILHGDLHDFLLVITLVKVYQCIFDHIPRPFFTQPIGNGLHGKKMPIPCSIG